MCPPIPMTPNLSLWLRSPVAVLEGLVYEPAPLETPEPHTAPLPLLLEAGW
jgi:hypothetical protein